MLRKGWNCDSNLYVIKMDIRLFFSNQLFTLQVNTDDISSPTSDDAASAKCDLIASLLHAFLLRVHLHLKTQRLGTSGVVRATGPFNMRPPLLLQPIIDLLQYQVFCERVKAEVDRMERALGVAGVPSGLRFNTIGESGKALVKLLNEDNAQKIGGEAILRIDDRY